MGKDSVYMRESINSFQIVVWKLNLVLQLIRRIILKYILKK
jgi:hypothetical protein